MSGAFCNSSWTMTLPWKSSKKESNPKQGFYVLKPPELLPRRFVWYHKTWLMADAECWWHSSRLAADNATTRPCPTAPPLLQTGSNCTLLKHIYLYLETDHFSHFISSCFKPVTFMSNQGQTPSPQLPLSPPSTQSHSPIHQSLKKRGTSKAAA